MMSSEEEPLLPDREKLKAPERIITIASRSSACKSWLLALIQRACGRWAATAWRQPTSTTIGVITCGTWLV